VPAPEPQRFYSPAEVSRLLGVSPKALRLYEARGLVTAMRASNGWRVYGRAEIARLTQVLALKALRLPLARIAELINGVSLDQALAAHEQVLRRDAAQAARALRLVRTARGKLAAGEALSIDDLATLAKETVMTRKSTPKEMGELLMPFVARHFSDADLERTRQAAGDFDRDQVAKDWDLLLTEVKALMEAGDSTSPQAVSVARRWKAGVEAFSIEPEMQAKARAVWQDALADPETAPRLPIDPGVFAFVRQILQQAGA
jgi:DNA-binding transcriptional MerR regulator